MRERYPGVLLSTDAGAAFTDPSVDAVVIATPTATHAELVRSALRAGKHVLVEKPLTDGSASARELCRLAEQMGRVLLVGHVFLYNPAVRWIKDRIERGSMGRIYHLSSTRTNLGPIRVDVSAAWDLAAQDIAIFNHWLGAAPISRLRARTRLDQPGHRGRRVRHPALSRSRAGERARVVAQPAQGARPSPSSPIARC